MLYVVMARKAMNHDLRVVTWRDPGYEGRRDKIAARFILGDIATVCPGEEIRVRLGKKNSKVWTGTYEGTVEEVEKAALASAQPSPSPPASPPPSPPPTSRTRKRQTAGKTKVYTVHVIGFSRTCSARC